MGKRGVNCLISNIQTVCAHRPKICPSQVLAEELINMVFHFKHFELDSVPRLQPCALVMSSLLLDIFKKGLDDKPQVSSR